jgi:hypothetical protein
VWKKWKRTSAGSRSEKKMQGTDKLRKSKKSSKPRDPHNVNGLTNLLTCKHKREKLSVGPAFSFLRDIGPTRAVVLSAVASRINVGWCVKPRSPRSKGGLHEPAYSNGKLPVRHISTHGCTRPWIALPLPYAMMTALPAS